ncbi:unnamed protein product [Linum trigynum]|uniref:Uncharacterized protein n=1 Tax=Linum trigynum TaxID=586398 RepID=A0AAV2EHL2_9ROSI
MDMIQELCRLVKEGHKLTVSLWCWYVALVWEDRCNRVFTAVRSSTELLMQIKQEVAYYSHGNPNFSLVLTSSPVYSVNYLSLIPS